MKSILNISTISLVALSFGFASCSDSYMDKINENNDNASDAPAKSLLADVLTSTAFHDVGGDMDTYISSYNEYEVGIGNQLWDAQTRVSGVTSSTTFGDSWNDIYADLGNARRVISKSNAAGDYNTAGMGEVMAAILSVIVTDNFGDVPYTQAALPYLTNGVPTYMNPAIDAQESIYDSIMVHLNNAITDFNSGATDSPGKYDYLYGGKVANWLKLAYGLKARYTLRLYDTYSAADKTAKMQEVISDVNNSFQSASDQAEYNLYSSTNRNPYYDFFVSRSYFAISPTYLAKLNDRSDPRLNRIIVAYVDTLGNEIDKQISYSDVNNGGYAPISGGGSEKIGKYNYSIYSYAATAPTFYMSYHELMFIAAEAYERLGDLTNAKIALKTAVVAAIANTESNITNVENSADELGNDWGEGVTMTTSAITPEQASDYFDNHVASLFNANPLQEIEIQKYLGLFGPNGEATEEYADIRRHKGAVEDYYNFGNPVNATQYPWELPYGNSGVTANKNVSAAYGDGQYVYSNCIWWAGGKGKHKGGEL